MKENETLKPHLAKCLQDGLKWFEPHKYGRVHIMSNPEYPPVPHLTGSKWEMVVFELQRQL